jgi:2-(1,2-epoxy-1,2-dihydrophenyl)acetyl-CoA isomerase
MEEAMKLANKIARGPLNCYSKSKALMNKAHETTLADLLKEETAEQAAVRMHANAEEGLGAFLEKRKAAFV